MFGYFIEVSVIMIGMVFNMKFYCIRFLFLKNLNIIMLFKIIQVWWITKWGAEQWKSDQTEPWWRRRWSCPRETLLRDVAGKRGQQRRHPLLRWWWRRRGRKKTDPRSVPGRSPQEAGPADRAEPENLDHHEQQRLPHHGRPRQQASSTTCQGTHQFLPFES